MKALHKLLLVVAFIVAGQVVLSFYCCTNPEQKTAASSTPMTQDEMVTRGGNLVTVGGCNDCHSPKIMTAQGPIPDSTRLLSGSPADMKLPTIDPAQVTPGKWYLGSSDLTAWVGPWGISYSANLTADSVTGTGSWTADFFVKVLRGGKFMGIDAGRPIMPPMPSAFVKVLTDEDLKCIFAYLHSLPAIKNHVHDYVPPTEVANFIESNK